MKRVEAAVFPCVRRRGRFPTKKPPGPPPGAVPAVVGVSLALPGSGSIHTLGDWNSVLFRRVRPGMAFPFRRFVSGRVLVEAAVHPGSDRYFLRKTAGVPRQGASSQPISVPAASAARVAPGSATLASVLRIALSWQSACSAVLALSMAAAACSWASAMAASTCVAEGGLWPRPRSNRVSPAFCPAAPAIAGGGGGGHFYDWDDCDQYRERHLGLLAAPFRGALVFCGRVRSCFRSLYGSFCSLGFGLARLSACAPGDGLVRLFGGPRFVPAVGLRADLPGCLGPADVYAGGLGVGGARPGGLPPSRRGRRGRLPSPGVPGRGPG